MGASQRQKGSRAEREFINALKDQLGDFFGELDKNWNQREGQRWDLKLGPFGVEVKRVEKLQIASWWTEAVTQVKGTELMPMLAYRRSRQGWTIVLRLVDVAYILSRGQESINLKLAAPSFVDDWSNGIAFTMSLPMAAFTFLCREYLDPEQPVIPTLTDVTSVQREKLREMIPPMPATRRET